MVIVGKVPGEGNCSTFSLNLCIISLGQLFALNLKRIGNMGVMLSYTVTTLSKISSRSPWSYKNNLKSNEVFINIKALSCATIYFIHLMQLS